MKKWIAVVFAVFAASVSAQEEPLVNVYICYESGECGHAVTSQEFTPSEVAGILGEPAPGPNASVVCNEGDVCGWTELEENEIEVANGGDGIIEGIEEIDLDDIPAEAPIVVLEPEDPEAIAKDPTLDTEEYWVVTCRAGVCTTARSRASKNDTAILLNEEAPEGDVFVLCDEQGCRWQFWTEGIQPTDGDWFIVQRTIRTQNCPTDETITQNMVIDGNRSVIFSNPVQPKDIFTDTSAFDRVIQSMPSRNTYKLGLGIDSDFLSADVTYEWAVISAEFILVNVFIDIPSVFGGRCYIDIAAQANYQG